MPQEFRIVDKKLLDDLGLHLKQVSDSYNGLLTLSQTARALAGGAIVENMLYFVLRSAMLGASKATLSKIFSGYGPLSTLSARIDIALALGLVPDHVARDLRVVKDIRNIFAHTPVFASFSHAEIAALCKKLSTWSAERENYTSFQKAVEGCCLHMKSRIAPSHYAEFVELSEASFAKSGTAKPQRPD